MEEKRVIQWNQDRIKSLSRQNTLNAATEIINVCNLSGTTDVEKKCMVMESIERAIQMEGKIRGMDEI